MHTSESIIKWTRRGWISFLFLACLSAFSPARAQLMPCFERPSYLENPWTIPEWCLEEVIYDPDAGPLAFSALAVGDDGTLYATRPLLGQVLALPRADADSLPGNPQVIVEGLTRPNGLEFYDGSLYISGGPRLDRWRDGDLETLVDDLPSGPGFWTGGLAVGPDERLYIAIGAVCDDCPADDPLRGSILSFDLNGGDRQTVATGLRNPADVAWFGGSLWAADSMPESWVEPNADELNRIEPGGNYGWPDCIGVAACEGALPPAMSFPTHSAPVALAAYTGDLFPRLSDTLLVILGGSNNLPHMEGYALVAVRFEDGNPADYRLIIPGQDETTTQFTLQEMNYRGSGFWPRRPLSVAVSPEGWIYVSATDGQIVALRPLEASY